MNLKWKDHTGDKWYLLYEFNGKHYGVDYWDDCIHICLNIEVIQQLKMGTTYGWMDPDMITIIGGYDLYDVIQEDPQTFFMEHVL